MASSQGDEPETRSCTTAAYLRLCQGLLAGTGYCQLLLSFLAPQLSLPHLGRHLAQLQHGFLQLLLGMPLCQGQCLPPALAETDALQIIPELGPPWENLLTS